MSSKVQLSGNEMLPCPLLPWFRVEFVLIMSRQSFIRRSS